MKKIANITLILDTTDTEDMLTIEIAKWVDQRGYSLIAKSKYCAKLQKSAGYKYQV